jgi:hypothetical protein
MATDLKMEDVDTYMREAMDRYLNNDNFAGWFAESNAISIVKLLSEGGDAQATACIPILLSTNANNNFIQAQAQLDTALGEKRSADRQVELYERNKYNNYVQFHGLEKAEEEKNRLKATQNTSQTAYTAAVTNFENQQKIIKNGASSRFSAYIELRGSAFAGANDDPVVLLNKVITDVNNAYPEYNYKASEMNEQVKKIYGNYNTDLKYLNSVHTLVSDLSNNLVPTLEKKIRFKERQKEIQEYYHKQYEQQIFLVKLLVVFAIFALVGFIFLHYQLIPLTAFIIYLGIVFSIAFVVFFYYLWDFYIRDNQVFDEYQFDTYLPPSNGEVLRSTFKDNIIYC